MKTSVICSICFLVGLFSGLGMALLKYETDCYIEHDDFTRWYAKKFGGTPDSAFKTHRFCSKETTYMFFGRDIGRFVFNDKY